MCTTNKRRRITLSNELTLAANEVTNGAVDEVTVCAGRGVQRGGGTESDQGRCFNSGVGIFNGFWNADMMQATGGCVVWVCAVFDRGWTRNGN